ncbi:MAG: zinc ribbon domain-containing protein [Fidelibacterota bacterium]
MPMFDFRCSECGYIFEELIFGWNNDKEIICPQCQSQKTEKLMSAPAIGTAIGSSSCEFSTKNGCNAPAGSGFS